MKGPETNLHNDKEILNFGIGQKSDGNNAENIGKNIIFLNLKIISFHRKSYDFFFKTAGIKQGTYYI